jgi:PleD family two-component response regulator
MLLRIQSGLPDSQVFADSVIETTDEKLYQAKEDGRNTVRSQPL